MNKHTPKPWHVLKCGAHWNNPEIQNNRIASGKIPSGPNGFDVAWSDDGELVAEHVYEEADALLIAAAPELLEALQAIAECCDEEHAARDYASRQTEIRGIARAAIAKATGEQP